MPVQTTVLCRTTHIPGRWKRIEIYRTREIEEIASLQSIVKNIDTNCHFILCNGRIGGDGQIFPTEKWAQQKPVVHPSHQDVRANTQSEGTLYICILTNGSTDRPTNTQIKRTEALVLELCRRLRIPSKSVHYPKDWW